MPGRCEATSGERRASISTSEAKILVVDDKPENLAVAADVLEGRGFAVSTARDGETGLRRARTTRPSLVLLDVQMPGLDGYEVCRRMKADPELAELPVIFMSALVEAEDKARAFEVGAVDYVPKPVHPEELLARIDTHLALARLRRDLRERRGRLEQRVVERTRALVETNAALSRFVPETFLAALGHADIRGIARGESVRGVYTAMFSDIRGYTTLSERLGVARTFALLNAYFGRLGPVITAHGGTICQFQGDGLIAIFPDVGEAARAAVAQQRALEVLNEERGEALEAGIGLATGELTLAVAGDEDRLEPLVVGEPVERAMRMEELARSFGLRVVVSGRVEEVALRSLAGIAGEDAWELLDAEEEALRERKLACLAGFSAGQRAVAAGDFHGAVKAMTEVLEQVPGDRPARYLLEEAARALLEG